MERDPKDLQVYSHQDVETVDLEALQTKWKEQANVCQWYDG